MATTTTPGGCLRVPNAPKRVDSQHKQRAALEDAVGGPPPVTQAAGLLEGLLQLLIHPF